MNQADLISSIAAGTDQSKADVERTLKHLGMAVQYELKGGGDITLPGIGKLTVKQRLARTGRNPATGAEIDIPSKTVPKFSASKALKDALNN